MIYQTQLLFQFELLPENLQKQVLDFVAFLVSHYQVIGYDAQGHAITASALEESIHKARQEAMDRKLISHDDLKNELIDSVNS